MMITLNFNVGSGDVIKECDNKGSCLLTRDEVISCKKAIGADKDPKILFMIKFTPASLEATADGLKVATLVQNLLTTPTGTNKVKYDGLNIDISDLKTKDQLDFLLSKRSTETIALTMDSNQAALGKAIISNIDKIHHLFVRASSSDEINRLLLKEKPPGNISILFTGKDKADAKRMYYELEKKDWLKGYAFFSSIAKGPFAEAFDSC